MTPESPPPNSPPEDINELLRQSVDQMRHAVGVRDQLHVRVGSRVTSIIRVQMVTLAIASIGMTLLVGVLAWHFRYMVEAMETMNTHFRQMSEDMTTMQQVIVRMDSHMKGMPSISGDVVTMDRIIGNMRSDMNIIATSMNAMNQDILQVQGSVVRMTNTFDAMDTAVLGIGRDVNTMSAPMKDFNSIRSMMPMP